MKRAMVFGLALIVAAAAVSDTSASAREKGGRRGKKSGGESYSTYWYPTPTVVYQVYPNWVNPAMYGTPPTGTGYPTSTPTTPAITVPTPPTVTVPTTFTISTSVPTTSTLKTPTPEIAALIEVLRSEGYVK